MPIEKRVNNKLKKLFVSAKGILLLFTKQLGFACHRLFAAKFHLQIQTVWLLDHTMEKRIFQGSVLKMIRRIYQIVLLLTLYYVFQGLDKIQPIPPTCYL